MADTSSLRVLSELLETIDAPRPRPVRELLAHVLERSRQLTGAEAGTVFILRGRGDSRRLEAASVQNDRVRVRCADLVVPVTTDSVAGYTATTGETVFVDDLYAIPPARPYRFDPSFDRASGYRSRSMLSFPLVNYRGGVIGVVQLINRRDDGGDPLPFSDEQAELVVPFKHIVGSAVERADMLHRISDANRRLRERNRLLKEQRQRIAALQDETEEAFQLSIRLLARAAELHDDTTAQHVERVNAYAGFLAERIGCPPGFCAEIRYSAQLHDVGKMSVDAAILRKRGPLDAGEQAEMRRHPEYGWEILSASERLHMAAEIALCHHERWDGRGYPRGLSGDAIPLAARIVVLADVYDALRSERPYKPAHDHRAAVDTIRAEPDHIDPRLLEVFTTDHLEMDRIWRESDGGSPGGCSHL